MPLTNDQIETIAKKIKKHDKELSQMSPEWRAAFKARFKWLTIALPHQIPPLESDWKTWMLLAGRGAGKTRLAAEYTWWKAWSEPKTRHLVVGPTSADIRDVLFGGESGLLNVIPPEIIENYGISLHELTLKNGSLIKGIAASEPSRFRGPQWHSVWFDELCAYQYLDETWDMVMFSLRLGKDPKTIITTTPKPVPKVVELNAQNGNGEVWVTTASTYSNLANLAPTFQKQLLQYEGTSLGRQEIHAEILDPEESGLIKRSWFKLWNAEKSFPEFSYVIQSYDCAASDKTINDPTACVVLGVFKPNEDKGNRVMLIDCWSERLLYPDLRQKLQDEFEEIYGNPDEFGSGKKVDLVLVENKSSGIALIQDLQKTRIPIRGYNPGNADKATRLNIVAPIIEKGMVYLPESTERSGQPRTWVEPFLSEVCSFPLSRHDDYVDAIAQALRYLRDANIIAIDYFFTQTDDYADDEYRKRAENPYSM
jgi:predicted phage terminase large subunit-like protein